VHLDEGEFLIEVIDPLTLKPAGGASSSLQIRVGLDRRFFDTARGTMQRSTEMAADAAAFCAMDGGVIGRIDQKLIVRGVNIFPGSLESIVRFFPHVQEFRMIVDNKTPWMSSISSSIGQATILKMELKPLDVKPPTGLVCELGSSLRPSRCRDLK
jgi:hypothetical protein